MQFVDQPGNPDQGSFLQSGGGDFVGALINTTGMLYDSYQNRKASKENTNKTIAAQKAEAELAYQRSVSDWNRQNLYNDPESQMARFKAAGLNPNLIYGQGNAGNASSTPSYQPANLQYKYEAPAYGAAISSILPTLMQVGSWVQSMRLSEASLDKTVTETDRSQQMIDFLLQKNPKELTSMDNKLSLYPYQRNMTRVAADTAQSKLFELEQKFRNDYGEDLFSEMGSAFSGKRSPIGGLQRLKFLQEISKSQLMDLDYDVKSSWADFDITNPQAIIQMVLSGVMGMAGNQLRLSTHKGRPARGSSEAPIGVRRLHPSRRVQNRR